MFASFNKAFKEKLVVSEEILERSEKCSKCEHLKKVMDNHHWVYRCKNECELR